MRLNFKTLAIVAAAVIMGMTACSKENDTTSDENGKITTVSISLTQNSGTKAVGDFQDNTTVSFSSGYVLFTNPSGIVVKITQIVPGSFPASPDAADQAAKDSGSKVWLDDMKVNDGSEIKNVPGNAEKVYIIGNLPAGVNAPVVAENIADIKNRTISIGSQNKTDGSTDNVTLFGGGADLTVLTADTKYAKVTVDAIASRIEIGKVSYVNAATNFITKFQIDGIFVNYYYNNMTLSSGISAEPINNAPANNAAADLMYAANTTEYPLALNNLIYDFDIDGIGTSVGSLVSYQPGAANQVWAYNVLAPKTFAAPATAILAPHVVIRLSDIETTGDAALSPDKVYETTQYLTIKKFINKANGTEISTFQPGHVYFITNLTFDESNLTDIPEAATISAYVEVSLMEWTRVEVDWGF